MSIRIDRPRMLSSFPRRAYIASANFVLKEDLISVKRMTTTSLVLSLLILTAAPLRSQTRPRRVAPNPETPLERPLERPVERPRNRNWMRVLLGTGIAI